jgi:hypothetical protein
MGKIIGMLITLWLPLYLPADDSENTNEVNTVVEAATSAAEKSVSHPALVAEYKALRFEGRSPPKVPPRQQKLVFYPCSQCHKYWQTNPIPHELAPVHRVGLNHGQNRFWCLTCHDDEDRDSLHTERDGKVGFNESWRVCGQCHAKRQKDWYFGAHGKRVNGWQEEPVRYNCTHCHNPHFPPFEKRQPQPKPPVRVGLEPMKKPLRQFQRIWERHEAKTREAQYD